MSANVDEMRREAKLAFDAEYDEWPGALCRWADALEATERRVAELEAKVDELECTLDDEEDSGAETLELWKQSESENKRLRDERIESAEKRVVELEAAIAKHRDQKGDDRCWVDDHELYEKIGDRNEVNLALPPRCDFLKSCERYWEQRQSMANKFELKQMTIRQLENRIAELEGKLRELKVASCYKDGCTCGPCQIIRSAVSD